MTGQDAIRTALLSSRSIVTMLLGDLEDADLLVRPVTGASHIAFMMGHLIVTERMIGSQLLPGAPYPNLPPGYADQHGPANQHRDPPTGFGPKEEYLDRFTRVRQVTIDGLAKLSETDLDRPTEGRLFKLAPTLGAALLLVANHTAMHAGQFSTIRRKLGKSVLF
jgi:hypothetical protein